MLWYFLILALQLFQAISMWFLHAAGSTRNSDFRIDAMVFSDFYHRILQEISSLSPIVILIQSEIQNPASNSRCDTESLHKGTLTMLSDSHILLNLRYLNSLNPIRFAA
ncbi:hypothetical protein L2E82_50035 [Cichorium intybus]|nr:hypothetical protein L2E82_50035 [Cichorium intybus]